MNPQRTVFVSGFPGPVARRVARGVRDFGHRVGLITPASQRKAATKFIGGNEKDVKIIEGELGHIDLGMAGSDYLEWANRITDIVYCDLPAPPNSRNKKSEVRKQVRELIELANAAMTPPRIFFLSHLDVAGDASGVFAEQDLDVGQRFIGEADEGRFRGERILKRFTNTLPICVIRSGWIVGPNPPLCPLVDLILAQEDPPSIPDRALSSPFHFIDAPSISQIILELLAVGDGVCGSTWHVSYGDVPPLGELIKEIRHLARDVAPTGTGLTHAARNRLRKQPPQNRWHYREFLKHIHFGTRIANGRTVNALAKMDSELPRFDDHIHHLVEGAVARWTNPPSA